MEPLERLDELKALFRRRISQKLKRLKKRIKNINDNLERFEKRDEFIRKGELIKLNLQLIKKGMKSIIIKDIFEPDQPEVEIKLDPKLSPVENMNSFFKVEHKMKKGTDIESDRLQDTDKEIKLLEKTLDFFLSLEDLDEAELIFRKHFGEPVEKKIVDKRLEKKIGKRYPYQGGVYIVGRKDKENDELVKKVAHGNDWWFHIRDYTGSHVILILPKGMDLDDDFLTTGAMLALINSKAKNSPKEEVIYTQVKNLKKIPGKPGLFSYSNVKSILAVYDKKKIQHLEELRQFQKI